MRYEKSIITMILFQFDYLIHSLEPVFVSPPAVRYIHRHYSAGFCPGRSPGKETLDILG